MLQCFQLEHPDNEMVLCDRPKCEAIADYLEVELDGTEHRLCAFQLSNFASPQSVDPSEWVKFEVVFLIKPRTFEELQRQPSPSGEGKGVDGQLYVGVRFFSCIRLVVEDMQVTIPDLEEINVAGDDLSLEVEGELVMAVIGEIGCRGARRICRSW